MGRRRRSNKRESWLKFFLSVMMILCVYFILALFDSSLAGDSGRNLGKYLRASLGGSAIVLLLFWFYLCTAFMMKLKIPRLPRQVLGTLQLYVSFAFMLGLLKEAGWDSERTLFLPGGFGHGLARFFVLNIGTFLTLILVVGSFILSMYLYGSRLLSLSLPEMPALKLLMSRLKRREQSRRPRRHRESDFPEDRPERILFTGNTERDDLGVYVPTFKEPEPKQDVQTPIEVYDNILAMLDSAPSSEPRRPAKTILTPRRIRRPLLTEDDEPDSKGDSGFPPPIEIFGSAPKLRLRAETPRMSDEQAKLIVAALRDFGISASVAGTVTGASVIQYQLELAPGTKLSALAGLDDELTMSLAVRSVRIEAPILGTRYAGVEVPNPERRTVTLRSVIESDAFANSGARLPLPLGERVDGKVIVQGLEEMPHVIVAGNKGSGKSTFLNSCIMSLCSVRRPEELRMILIDTRNAGLAVYEGLPHLLASPVYDSGSARKALRWAIDEMETRTEDFVSMRAKNLASYNRKLPKNKRLPEIVIVIDELADLTSELETQIVRLAQKGGSCGIHLVLSAQRPSDDVITSSIRHNVPACVLFQMSREDSKNLAGDSDAFRLTGKGDMLFRSPGGSQVIRLQAPYIAEDRIPDFVDYMNDNLNGPELIEF